MLGLIALPGAASAKLELVDAISSEAAPRTVPALYRFRLFIVSFLPFIIQFSLLYLLKQMTLPSVVDIYSFPPAAAMPSNTGLLSNLISWSLLPSPVEMTWSRAPFLPSRAAT